MSQPSKELAPQVVRLTDKIYVACFFDASSVGMILDESGIVLVDTALMPSAAATILAEFRKITTKPIKGVIFTHGHPDHTGGFSAFVPDGEKVEIWGRHNFNSEGRLYAEAGLIPLFKLRGGRQSGAFLPVEKRGNSGIAPEPKASANTSIFDASRKPPVPTQPFTGDSMKIQNLSLPIELWNMPGETTDQLAVWLPEDKVLFCGDNFYASFPNMYPVRGSSYRDVKVWLDSVAKLATFGAEHLVTGHGLPISGKEKIAEILANYHAAIAHILEKTIEGMNQGLGPDVLAHTVILPEHLAKLDYLQEGYGNVAWTVRSIFSGYMGWFDGNPTTMNPLPPLAQAKHMAQLAGGEQALLAKAKQALADNEAQWAAQLLDTLLILQPQNQELKNLKADALEKIASTLITATGINYYLSCAMQLREGSLL